MLVRHLKQYFNTMTYWTYCIEFKYYALKRNMCFYNIYNIRKTEVETN
jgi:hypothetical protein